MKKFEQINNRLIVNLTARKELYLDPHHIMPTAFYVNSTVYALMATSISVNAERVVLNDNKRPDSPLLRILNQFYSPTEIIVNMLVLL